MRRLLCGAVAVLTLLAVSAAVRAEDEKVPLDKLPKEVTEAVKKKFPKAELVKASKEDMEGKPVYEVNIKAEDTTMDVIVTPDGKIVLIEKTIKAKDLPKAVAEALETKYPKATHKKIEAIIKDDKIEKYEILLVTADKKTLEVTFDPKGKLLDEEKQEEKKSGENEKGEKNQQEEQGASSDNGEKAQKNQKGDNKEVKDEKGDKKKSKKDDNDEDDDKGKKNTKKDDDDKDEKKGKSKKDDDDDKDEKKGKGGKEDAKRSGMTVDLSKLPPDVAKKIRELVKELEKANKSEKDEKKGTSKKDDDKDEKKGKNKKDDDNDKDEKKGKGKKNEDKDEN